MSRVTNLVATLTTGLVRDGREAGGMLRASAESDRFRLLAARRAAAAAELRAVESARRALAGLQEHAETAPGELRQTFSTAVPLVQRCHAVLRQQVALLDGGLRESAGRLRALAAEMEQNAVVSTTPPEMLWAAWKWAAESPPFRGR